MFNAKVIAASIGPNDIPLFSVQATYPRFIHSELMTHRAFSRNAASSRAIPWHRMEEMIMDNPVIPLSFGREQGSMQTGEALQGHELKIATSIWLDARDVAVRQASKLAELGVHKSICNRLTEPFMWITTLITATDWKNFFRLRVHKDAEIHFQHIASMIKQAINESEPQRLEAGEWHLPYILPGEGEQIADIDRTKKISAARCARLSYLTHDGKRQIQKDLGLFAKLIEREDNVLHCSPLEHVAEAMPKTSVVPQSGNFRGWKQFRKEYQNENVI